MQQLGFELETCQLQIQYPSHYVSHTFYTKTVASENF